MPPKGGIRINWVLWKLELKMFVHDPKLHEGLVHYSNLPLNIIILRIVIIRKYNNNNSNSISSSSWISVMGLHLYKSFCLILGFSLPNQNKQSLQQLLISLWIPCWHSGRSSNWTLSSQWSSIFLLGQGSCKIALNKSSTMYGLNR